MQNFANSKDLINIIERILVIGLSEEDIKNIIPKDNETKPKVLEDFKCLDYIDSSHDNYSESIDIFCFPEGLKIRNDGKNNVNTYHSFCLTTRTNVRRHCYCLTFHEIYEVNINKYAVPKAICLVSKFPLYTMMKDILKNIYSILTNFKANRKLFPEKLNYVFLKEKSKSYTVIKEYSLLEFYFGFILNSIKLKRGDKSFATYYMSNNSGKKYFLKFHLNDKTTFGVPDFDLTILLDKFNVEDLIKIYTAMLMEYKVFIVFDNYEDINIIIWSLISLLFPMKWNLTIIPFMGKKLDPEFLESIVPTIIGCPSVLISMINDKLNNKLITEDTVIYNITTKSFMNLPHLGELAPKILDNLKSNIYYILSEKFKFSTNDYADSELTKIFSLDIVEKLNYNIYLNLKLIQAFFNTFLELIKNLEQTINMDVLSSFISSASTTNSTKKERIFPNNFFDREKFIYSREFCNDKNYIYLIDSLTKTQLFMSFLEDFLLSEGKTKLLKQYLSILNSGDKGSKLLLKELLRDQIKNTILNYYEFNYISMEMALKVYIEKYGSIKSKSLNEKLLWNTLDKNKVNRFNFSYHKLLLNDNDERIQDDFFIKLNKDLTKYKDQKSFEIFDDDSEIPKLNKEYDKKLKTHLEEYYSNSQQNSINNTSIHKNNKSIEINSLDCSNLNVSRNNNNTSRVFSGGEITPKKIPNYRAMNYISSNFNTSGISNEHLEKSFLPNNKTSIEFLYLADLKKQFSIGDFSSRTNLLADHKQILSIKDMKNITSFHHNTQRKSIDISQLNKNPNNLIAQLQCSHNHLNLFKKKTQFQISDNLSNSNMNINSVSMNESSDYFKRLCTFKNIDITNRSRESSVLKNCESLQKLIGDDDDLIFDEPSKNVQY